MTTQPASTPEVFEPFDRGVARSATGLLAALNTPDLLTAPDIQVARRLGRLGGCDEERVLAAVALVVRAVRQGSVCVDLERISATVDGDAGGEGSAPSGSMQAWRELLLSTTLVRAADAAAVTPLVLDGELLYLDRYWAEEGQVVADVLQRRAGVPDVPADLEASLDDYFPPAADGVDDFPDQRRATLAACRNRLTVITGGPGTGKTTTVARLLGVLLDADPELRIALAAPTGRAAARLGEAVADATRHETFPATYRERIAGLQAVTLHRLLGWQPSRRGFRHDRTNRLPYDVVVVDETSMVSLTLMARLLEAVRPQARLVLVGDADQLASVDAGAVLGDLVTGLGRDSDQVCELGPSRRFGARIRALAEAIRASDADEVVRLLTQSAAPGTDAEADDDGVIELVDSYDAVEPVAVDHAVRLREVALSGDVGRAVAQLDEHRLLCAHREGPFGAGHWNRRVERALAERERLPALGGWYAGRPLIVTENDYGLRLFNGDLGVVVPVEVEEGRPTMVAFIADGSGGAREALSTARLAEVRSAHAMTVHRSQGSQVEEVTVLLPDTASMLLTRELLYTAVTRAKKRVRVVGSEEAVRAAVEHRAQRASGLADRLRPPPRH